MKPCPEPLKTFIYFQEEERARMLREAVTDEDKARVRAEIEAKLAEEAAIVGSRSHR